MSKEHEKSSEEYRGDLFNAHWLSLNSLVRSSGKDLRGGLDIPLLKKIKLCQTEMSLDLDLTLSVPGTGSVNLADSSHLEPQDADYTPSLSNELEVSILCRLPLPEQWKISSLSKTYLSLSKSGELFEIRRELGVKRLYVFMLASGDENWWLFDRQFMSRKRLPVLPDDGCFMSSDKETLCAGTHLLVSGREINGHCIWRYNIITNEWGRGPSMINPRCLFASATGGESAFVAGGTGLGPVKGALDLAEKYNSETGSWELLPSMKRKRKLCAGAYMDNKFYAVGGQNENGEPLTCGEVFHEDKNMWVMIPGMLEDSLVADSASPPLLAVVNNQLFAIQTSSNELKLYEKKSNRWKNLGRVPVCTDFNKGWGVAFKSLGDELLVMGRSIVHDSGEWMSIYTCRPDLNGGNLQWELVNTRGHRPSHFIFNCCIMAA